MQRQCFALLSCLWVLFALGLSSCDPQPTSPPTKAVSPRPPAHGDAREPLTHADALDEPATARSIIAALRDEVVNNNSAENPDHLFVHLLEVYHHRGLDLAQVQLRGGQDAALRLMADTLRHRSQRNAQQLAALSLNQHRPGTDFRATSPAQVRTLQQALHQIRRMLATPVKATTPDQEFAAFMELYYQSGLLLAQTELRYGREATQKTLARQWSAAQQRELRALQAWQATARPVP